MGISIVSAEEFDAKRRAMAWIAERESFTADTAADWIFEAKPTRDELAGMLDVLFAYVANVSSP